MNILQKAVSCLTAALIILSFTVLAYAERAAIPVYVAIDKSTLLTLKEAGKRVSITNPKIAELNLVSPKEVALRHSSYGTHRAKPHFSTSS